ncbi:MAG TPA: protoporphyrinogen oxidase [Actinomycetota bacterium]|nr:protoporphyrinogen oxidase [Actinomycetota bacterium]
MGTVAVVGGGISGLSCAWFLQQRGHDVVVYEASDRLGGKLMTGTIGGVPVELGADSFLPRDDLPLELCRAVGLGDDLISPAVFGAYIWHDAALRKLPAGFSYGIPVRPWAAYRARLLSLGGTLRASTEMLRFRRLREYKVAVAPTIGSFVARRFGRETLENLVDPLLAGTRAGRPDEISLDAGAPEIHRISTTRGSVIRGLRAMQQEIGAGSPHFVSLRGGLSRLAEALADRLPDVRTNSPAEKLPDADAVVLATPPWETARLLADERPGVEELLAPIRYESSATVTLLYPRDTFTFPADGSGVLVPSKAGMTLTAATWYSHKWPHARPADGSQIVRCFVGGRGRELPSDDEAVEGATRDVAKVMGVNVQPTEVRVTRWEGGLPIFSLGHVSRIIGLDDELPKASRIAVAGAYLTGSGIPECIAHAKRAAGQINAYFQVGSKS